MIGNGGLSSSGYQRDDIAVTDNNQHFTVPYARSPRGERLDETRVSLPN